MTLKGKQLDAFNEAIKSGGDVHAALQKTCEQVEAVGQANSSPKPLTASEILEMANRGEAIPADRALATYADPAKWVQLPKACEWAFIGPMRPGYELAQHAAKSPQERAIAKVLERKPFHPFEGSQLLKGVKALTDPNWHAMTDEERLLHACLHAYAKHHLGLNLVGWDRLGEILHDAICQNVGDDEYVKWGKRIKMELDADAD